MGVFDSVFQRLFHRQESGSWQASTHQEEAESLRRVEYVEEDSKEAFDEDGAERRNPVCPASVSQTPDDVEGFRVIYRLPFYADLVKLEGLSEEEQKEAVGKLIDEGRCYEPHLVVDIHSKGNFFSSTLSNFFETDILFDGVRIRSMEGFLQSLKTPDREEQKRICLLVGKEAKKAGLEVPGFDQKTLWWNGQKIDRFSEEYTELLKRAYRTQFEQNEEFREALIKSRNRTLIHSIGNNKKSETILTADEFTGILEEIRAEYRKSL